MVRHLLELVDVVAVDPHLVLAQIPRAAAPCPINPPAIVKKCLCRDRARARSIRALWSAISLSSSTSSPSTHISSSLRFSVRPHPVQSNHQPSYRSALGGTGPGAY